MPSAVRTLQNHGHEILFSVVRASSLWPGDFALHEFADQAGIGYAAMAGPLLERPAGAWAPAC